MEHARGTQPTRVHTQARKYQARGFHHFILLISSQRWDFLSTSSQKTPWGALLPLRSNPTLALPDTPSYFLAGWERSRKRFCLIEDRYGFPEMTGETHQPSLRPARPAWPLPRHLRGLPLQPRSRGPWALVNPADRDYSNVIM